MIRRIATLLLLMVLALSLLVSVPALRPVLITIRHMSASWIAAAIALELASCVSFVVLFRRFFDRLAPRDARSLAWAEMASGALLPGGGAGGLAIGGWLMHLGGAPTAWIVRRSGGLFFLTSAVNATTVVSAGLLLGFEGSRPITLTVLPAALATSATLAVACLPRLRRAGARLPRWLDSIVAGVADAEQTTFKDPSWRLVGALGYLGFDMAVLWVTLRAVGEPLSAPALILAYNIGYLANLLPIPGSVGVLDAGLAGSLLLYGAGPAHVAAAVLVYHAIALWVPGLGGTFAYVRARSRLASRSIPVVSEAHRPQTALLTKGNTMYANALMLTPIRHGWAVVLTGGRQIAKFHGPGAQYRAQRYLAEIARREAPGRSSSSPEWRATC